MGSSSSSPLLRLLALVVLAWPALGLPQNHRIRSLVDKLNRRSDPFVGLVMAYATEKQVLESSGNFAADFALPYVDLYGIAVQVLLDYFQLRGIVHYGTAGGADDSLSFGDVSVPKHVAFTGAWKWLVFLYFKSPRVNSVVLVDQQIVSESWYICVLPQQLSLKMSDNLMEKVSAFGERLKIGGAEVSRKVSSGMSSMSFKMKEFFQGQNQAEKIVEDATSENLEGPDWALNLDICDMINSEKVNSVDFIRGIKKRIILKSPRVQYLALVLLETCVKNCEKAFSEVAAERVLDEMVKLIDDPQTVVNNRNKALILIEAWGESGSELRYLPVYEETYKSLKSRGIRFPGRDNESLAPIFTPPRSVSEEEANTYAPQQIHQDVSVHSFTPEQSKEALDVARNSVELLSTVLSSSPQQDVLQDDLTTTLVQQCHESQYTVQRIIMTAGDDGALIFEALNVNDEIQKVLSRYDDMQKPPAAQPEAEPAMIPVAVEPDESLKISKEDALIRKPAGSSARGHEDEDILHDLDEMIFGKKGTSASASEGQDPKKAQKQKDDLITF